MMRKARDLLGPRPRETLNIVEWLRFLAERFVLIPAATWLPLPVAVAIADAIGALDALLPTETSRSARRELRVALNVSGKELERELRRKLAMPRHDILWRQRMRRGRERIGDWRLIEANAHPVHQLLAARRSFIIAGGHFVQAPGDVRHKVLPLQGRALGGAVPRWRLSPSELRRRLDAQVDQGSREGLLGIRTRGRNLMEHVAQMPDLWERHLDWAQAQPQRNIQDELLDELSRPGAVCQILIDAYWEKPGAYRRPFAGIQERGFAVGAARIARLAQCPVVPFVIVFGPERRTAVLEWGDPIGPPAIAERNSDRKVIDEALAFLERGVARYPSQYLHPIGSRRHFDSATATWRSS